MSGVRTLAMRWLGLAAASALTVWAWYHPTDSTALEQGQALGFSLAVISLVGAGVCVRACLPLSTGLRGRRAAWWHDSSGWVDVTALALAGWVLLAAWWTAGVFSSAAPTVGGDLRAATNEAWWWIAASGLFVLARRLVCDRQSALAIFGLLLAGGVLLGVHTLHQHFISLPQTLQEYLDDPDGTLAKLGLEAPAGSAARMIFENRMRDGGPTATFALANSLAGPLAMSVILAGGLLIDLLARCRADAALRSARTGTIILMLSTIVGLLLTAVLTTGSRSGVLSLLIVSLVLICMRLYRPQRSVSQAAGPHHAGGGGVGSKPPHPKANLRGSQSCARHGILAAVSIFGLLVVAVLLRYGRMLSNAEWIAQAPATIQLRLQYWWSTLAMIYDHPWFGAGPGNFQLVYQKYRDVRAHELIAEPHNFFFETLACGGVPGGLLLITCLVASVMYVRRTSAAATETDTSDNQSSQRVPDLSTIIGIAAFIGVAVVWYSGITSGELPDFEAHSWALPLAMAAYGGWWFAVRSGVIVFSMAQCRKIATAATATGLIHLCFSGGWTIPGVAIFLIWFAAIATAVPIAAPEHESKVQKLSRGTWQEALPRIIPAVVWLVLLVVAVLFSWLPVRQTQARLAEASMFLNTNRVALAERNLHSIVASDPLDRDAAVWLAMIENQHWMQAMLAASPASSPPRQKQAADAAVSVAIRRSGNDPIRLREIGEQLLQRYQVGGELADLEKANELFGIARGLSPTHESITAQQAEVLRELERRGVQSSTITAEQLARRAEQLATAGGVLTRHLSLQPILRAQRIGRAALRMPARMNADQVLQSAP